jgi:uncharacterized protein DUF4242
MDTRTFVVERYLPGLSEAEVLVAATRIRAAVAEMAAEGIAVSYLGSTFVPADEACFCEFEGPSAEAIAQANERAALPFARVIPAVRVAFERGDAP